MTGRRQGLFHTAVLPGNRDLWDGRFVYLLCFSPIYELVLPRIKLTYHMLFMYLLQEFRR